MAVIINELEVVVDSAQAAPQAAGQPAASATTPPAIGVLDFADVEDRLLLYRLRVLAH